MIQIQGIDRVDLTHRIDDVRGRIAAIESKFGIGGDFQTALNRELNKGLIAETKQSEAAKRIVEETKSLLNGSQPVNENDAINAAKVAEALNSAKNNENKTVTAPPAVNQNPVVNPAVNNLPGVEALPGKIMQNNVTNPVANNSSAAISSQPAPKTSTVEESSDLDESLFESDNVTEVIPTAQKVESTAEKYEVDPKLAKAVALAESSMDQNDISEEGAIGVMQLMPNTAVELGVDPYDEDENIEGGVRFLKQMLERFNGNVELAVAAYNAGPGAVEKFGGIPPYGETQAYVERVMNLYK